MESVTKTVYVLVGLPFAGKTTYTKQLAQSGECLVIERDAFLEDINRDSVTREKLAQQAQTITAPISRLHDDVGRNAFNDAVTLEYVRRVTLAIDNSTASTIIVDGTHLQALSRSFVKQINNAHKIAVVFAPNPELSIERLSGEELVGVRKTVTPVLIRRMAEVFEMPRLEEGFDEIISP